MSKAFTKHPLHSPCGLIRIHYEPFPGPLNCTSFPSTRDFAADPSHPFHIRTLRRLEDFDATKLHWRVQCPVDVSKKAYVRGVVGRKWRNAFRRALVGEEGGPKGLEDGAHEGGSVAVRSKYEGLSGALLVLLAKDSKKILTASGQQMDESVQWALHRVSQLQNYARRTEGREQRAPRRRDDRVVMRRTEMKPDAERMTTVWP